MPYLSRTSMKSFEKSEKSLKIVLHERDLLFESERQDFKKQLSYEKTKSDRMQKLACEIKDDYLRKHALLIQESLTKDETIKKLTGSLIRLSAKASQKTPLDQKNNKSQASCNKENREIELLKTNEIEGSATQRTNEEALTTKSRNKSYSACNNSKSKSCLSGQNEENIEGLKKIDLGKLEGKRSISRLKNMRKESYYDKKAGISHQIGKNLSLRVIHDFENKTVFLKNL